MNKNEFLKILRQSLELYFDKSTTEKHIDYYDNYISNEMKNGKSETDVINELGDPRLIAKTIKTVNHSNNNFSTNSFDNTETNNDTTNYNEFNNTTHKNIFVNNTNSIFVLGCTIAFLVMFIIIMGIFRFIGYFAYGLGDLALSGPIGFIIVISFLYLILFNKRR